MFYSKFTIELRLLGITIINIGCNFKKDSINESENCDETISMGMKTLDELYKNGIKDDSQFELEFFFYTNSENNAKNLSYVLKTFNYSSSYHLTENKEYVITGWSTPVKMDRKSIETWIKKMYELAGNNHSDFDGWGTNIDKNLIKNMESTKNKDIENLISSLKNSMQNYMKEANPSYSQTDIHTCSNLLTDYTKKILKSKSKKEGMQILPKIGENGK